MNVLSGAITASSAALVDAGIDCVDLVSGGVAALGGEKTVVDPAIGEALQEGGVHAACVVGYLQARDEITELWARGDIGPSYEKLVNRAVEAAVMTRGILSETLKEATVQKLAILERRAQAEVDKGAAQADPSEVNME